MDIARINWKALMETLTMNNINRFFAREKIDVMSLEREQEPYFSWSSCDCCGSTLGGDRQDYIGFNSQEPDVEYEYSVCVDCMFSLEGVGE